MYKKTDGGTCAVRFCLTLLFLAAVMVLSAVFSTDHAFAADTEIGNAKAKIITTNTADGYVRIAYTGGGSARTKVVMNGPKGGQYTYDINNKGTMEIFPLSEGDGSYTVGVYVNTSGSKYSTAFSGNITVKLKDEFAPFVVTNQFVDFTDKTKCVTEAPGIIKAAGAQKDIDKIKAIYEYVVKSFSYDKAKAESVKSGYLPVLDSIWDAKKGICFDYASMMAAMLRSQKIPCKLVVGYAGTTYHAWIDVYTKETGWINNMIEFDGKNWKLMDPTFASSGKQSASVMKYIGDGKNYSAKYYY